jgi:hypothetical protein
MTEEWKIEFENDNCDLRMQSGTVQQLKELTLKKWGKKINFWVN